MVLEREGTCERGCRVVLILHRLTSSAKVETKILSFHGLSPYVDLPGMSTIVPALAKSPTLLVPRRGES